MPGLFDGLRIGIGGVLSHRTRMEVTGNNIANASNETYTRQDVRVSTVSSVSQDGRTFLGQGVKIDDIVRIRDELLDKQLRHSMSNTGSDNVQVEWLKKVQAIWNEPSDTGISASLTKFWQSWSSLSNDPENFAARAGVMARTKDVSTLLNQSSEKLNRLKDEIDQSLTQTIREVNNLSEQIANLNREILQIEAGGINKANDLRDKRDAAVDAMSNKIGVSYKEESNGTLTVYIGMHPAVYNDRFEKLVTQPTSLDHSKLAVMWDYGENFVDSSNGELSGLLQVRDTIIPEFQANLDSFAALLVDEVNKIYSNGVGMDPYTVLESRLGYEAFGVEDTQTSLGLIPEGQDGTVPGALHVSFYNSSGDVVRTAGVMVMSTDTYADIVQKLNQIPGLLASSLSASTNDGRLKIEMNTAAGANTLGEVSFAISDNVGGYDTSGFLAKVGLSQTDKAATLTGMDLNNLKAPLGVNSVAAVRAKALGLSGSFTINTFDTQTPTAADTKGLHMQQFRVAVSSSDSIDTIMARVNADLGAFGITMAMDATGTMLTLETSALTNATTGVVGATGNAMLVSFANTYTYPAGALDKPPLGYNGLGDNTGFLAKLQFNTLLQGSTAATIALDDRIDSAEEIHAGYTLATGDNRMALDLFNLQHRRVTASDQFTIGEDYQNFVADVGTKVSQAQNLYDNETIVLQNFKTERDRISGVNLDEELANMLLFQRSYQANARMISTFDEMAQELLRL